MRTKAKNQKQSIFVRILKSPVTALQKVTNFYMNSMSSCASRLGENTVVNCSIAPQVSQLPRNFSVSSSKDSKQEDELKDLIRAVSTKLSEAKIEINNVDQFQKPSTGLARAVEKRSYSVGMGKIGRIDEEAPCDFKGAEYPNVNLYPRCKSYAVPNRIAENNCALSKAWANDRAVQEAPHVRNIHGKIHPHEYPVLFNLCHSQGHTAPEYKPKECLAMLERFLATYPL